MTKKRDAEVVNLEAVRADLANAREAPAGDPTPPKRRDSGWPHLVWGGG